MKEKLINILREKVKPLTEEQYHDLERNTFQSPYSIYKQYNGMKFKILNEYFEDETREPFGCENSSAWFDNEGDICSERFFEIQLGNGVIITAEEEELNNYYINTKQM